MLGLRCCGSHSTLAQLLTRSFSGPRARIDITHRAEPLFGFLQCLKVAHVQTEALASFFEAAANEEAEALELGLLGVRQRHRRRRRA